MVQRPKSKFFPFLYLLITAVVMYSVNDMATSTNAYQEQGNRGMVYVALVAIIGLLGIYFLYRWYAFGLNFMKPAGVMTIIVVWVAFDNLILGNIIGSSNMWTSVTHTGLAMWWLLALFFGYYYPRYNINIEKQLMIFVIAMFFYYAWQFVSVLIESNAMHDEATVLNLIYRVVVFVPAIYLLKNKKLRNFLLVIIFIMTFASMKRGAIVILPVMMLAAFVVDNRNNKNAIKKILNVVAVLIFAIVVFFIADKISGGFLSSRFALEELMYGSSRSEKYAVAIYEIKLRSFGEFMLGVGSAPRPGVHNEILEFLYTFGFIGLVLYIVFIISLISRFIKLYKAKSKYASIYAMIVVYFIVVGLYSGVYFNHATFYLMLVIGMIESRVNEERTNEKNNRNNNPSRR